MPPPRQLPLFDEKSTEKSWNLRMDPGEYAVHYSNFQKGTVQPFCTVFPDFADAEVYAQEQVRQNPTLRCRIYDHQGFVGAPLYEVSGAHFKGESDLSPRIRRWVGGTFFFGGLLLVAFDWSTDFRLSWPGLIGSRLIIPGLALLVTEAMIMLHARRVRHHARGGSG